VRTGTFNDQREKNLLIQMAQVILLGLIQHTEDVSQAPLCEII